MLLEASSNTFLTQVDEINAGFLGNTFDNSLFLIILFIFLLIPTWQIEKDQKHTILFLKVIIFITLFIIYFAPFYEIINFPIHFLDSLLSSNFFSIYRIRMYEIIAIPSIIFLTARFSALSQIIEIKMTQFLETNKKNPSFQIKSYQINKTQLSRVVFISILIGSVWIVQKNTVNFAEEYAIPEDYNSLYLNLRSIEDQYLKENPSKSVRIYYSENSSMLYFLLYNGYKLDHILTPVGMNISLPSFIIFLNNIASGDIILIVQNEANYAYIQVNYAIYGFLLYNGTDIMAIRKN